MQSTQSIHCPFCGQGFELMLDPSVERQQFTIDCEICCRPLSVIVECSAGGTVSLDVQPN